MRTANSPLCSISLGVDRVDETDTNRGVLVATSLIGESSLWATTQFRRVRLEDAEILPGPLRSNLSPPEKWLICYGLHFLATGSTYLQSPLVF